MTDNRNEGNSRHITRLEKDAVNHGSNAEIARIKPEHLKCPNNSRKAENANEADSNEIRNVEINHVHTHICLVAGGGTILLVLASSAGGLSV